MLGDVVIAVGGEYGTLSEIGLARKVGRPVVVLEGWDLGEHVIASPRLGGRRSGVRAYRWIGTRDDGRSNSRVALGKRGNRGIGLEVCASFREGITVSWAPATMSKAGPQQRDSLTA